MKGVPAVDDVLHEDHVAPRDGPFHILHQAGIAARFGGGAVGGNTHEIEFVRDGDRLHQIRDETDASVQHADQKGGAVGIVAGDLISQLADAAPDIRRCDQDFHEVWHLQTGRFAAL